MSTDRRELEELMEKVGGKPILSKEGYIDEIEWKGKKWNPLSYAEAARKIKVSNSFQNGRAKAEQEIMNKAKESRIKFMNSDSAFSLYGKNYKTKAFLSDMEANNFIAKNPGWGVIGVKDGIVHVAKNSDKGE